MREIKFRGKRRDNGEWVYGYYIYNEHMGVTKHIIATKYAQIYVNSFYVDAKTVGQFTGLKDKNGIEVYEGDVLKDPKGKGEVKWVQEHCAFLVRTLNPHMYHYLESDERLTDSEVIGNIYENKELIEK